MLSQRKHTILQSLIQEYVISAHPVASSTLARYYVPRLSPATVRNELSWLEDRGYVAQPHTSAGRLPTTVGYRTFVNNLLLHPSQYGIFIARNSMRTAQEQATAAMQESGVSHAQQSFSSLAGAADKLAHIPEVLSTLAERNRGLMVFWVPQLSYSVIHRGLPLLLSQPEFSETSAALPIMQLLESRGDLMAIFEEVVTTGGLHIKIGSEHKEVQLYEFSLVAMRFDCTHISALAGGSTSANKGSSYGVVALFGPTRLDYEGAIGSISNLVKDLERPALKKRN